ncbi:MAG: hypothetical protein ACI3Z5_07575 [Paludibacteraceae bacterium]
MASLSHFKNLNDLVNCINREKELLRAIFGDRKTHVFSTDMAMELVGYRKERILYLIENGVIHESGNFIELEDVYLRFFEDVLDVNEEINVASVKECIDSLQENITYYLQENSENRKYHYLSIIRKKLRDIGLRTLRNVIDLKRNVDSTYKQEPNYDIKIQKLKNLDEKKESIRTLIRECERLITDKDKAFFALYSNPQIARTITDVRNEFTDANYNLLSIEQQIIEYIHQIEQQNLFIKKIRHLKYLRTQLIIEESTNIRQVLTEISPVWMENRQYNKMRLSLSTLQSNEEMAALIRKVGLQGGIIRKARIAAPALTQNDLQEKVEPLNEINPQEVWNAFRAGGKDLFSFILSYDYKVKRTIAQHAGLFCLLAVQHPDECKITDMYAKYETLEYPLIYAK